jgi:DNA-binding MarR family transcriptional regulator
MAVNAECASAYRSTKFVHTDQERVVLDALRASDEGYTREELCNATGLKLQSVTARITALIKNGSVVQKLRSSPDERGLWYQTRLTSSGKRAAVLVAR